MQKILLFVLVIFIVNVQSAEPYTQATIDALVAEANKVSGAAKAKAALSKQADSNAKALAEEDNKLLPALKEELATDLSAEKLSQKSYAAQLLATTQAQTLADSKRGLLAAAHLAVDQNNVIVKNLQLRKTAMTYTTTELVANQKKLTEAVDTAGTSLTHVQTQLTAWKKLADDKSSGDFSATPTTPAKLITYNADFAAIAPVNAVAKTGCTKLPTYYTAAEAWIAAGLLAKTNMISKEAYGTILLHLSNTITTQMSQLISLQVAVKDAAVTFQYDITKTSSVLGVYQKIINTEYDLVTKALTAALTGVKGQTVLAFELQAANSIATSTDSLWLAAKQLLSVELASLQAVVSKLETQQSLTDAKVVDWIKSQTAAYKATLVSAQDAALQIYKAKSASQAKHVQAQVNVALSTDKATAASVAKLVKSTLDKVVEAKEAAAKTVEGDVVSALKKAKTTIASAVKVEVANKKKADNDLAVKWNNSLKGDATTALTACQALVKKTHDANKSSTKLNFSVLSLIAGLIIMTMN